MQAIDILPWLSGWEFFKLLRIDCQSFQHPLYSIWTDPILENESKILQTSIKAKLHYIFYKLEHYSNLISYYASVTNWSVSRSNIYNFTQRVIDVLFYLQNQLITWLNSWKIYNKSMINDKCKRFIGVVGKFN